MTKAPGTVEVERRQQYLDKMIGGAEVLRPLVEECLDDDPAVRPTIATVCERIQVSKDACMKESSQAVITLYQQLKQSKEETRHKEIEIEQLRNDNKLLKNDNERLRNENEEQSTMVTDLRVIIDQMSSARNIQTQQVASQLNRVTLGEGLTAKGSKLKSEALPLISAVASGRCHFNWTQLADLPVPLYDVRVAVQHHKVYATGLSPVEDAVHQVYVYNINTDQWGQLPPSGHFSSVPHIIGDKLAIIGGRQSGTKKITNKVSTFDEDSQTWTSYYPDLLSVRGQPGVVSHLEHVIVAGGKLDKNTVQDDIEVLNWMENSHWRRIHVKLPVPMYDFNPTISDDHMIIVGYFSTDRKPEWGACKLPVADFIVGQYTYSRWTRLAPVTHSFTALVPNSSPPVIVGGWKSSHSTSTTDIKMYDNSDLDHSWENIGSLSSPRCAVGVAAVHNNAAIIVIGGCTKGDLKNNRKTSSLTVVELGQAD